MKSPIRYFGSKGGFSGKIIEYFPEGYEDMIYLEAFCGSAALFFHKNISKVEVINDINNNIYAIFKVISDEDLFQEFKNKLDLTPYHETLSEEYKKDLKGDLSLLDRAYKYFYVNRTVYNGVGGFTINNSIRRGMSKSVSDYLSAVDRLPEIHDRLSRVAIFNRDAIELIKKYDKEDVFMYLDSPYANETRSSGRYENDFTDEQQDEYLNTLISIENAKVLVSGYACERYEILERNGYQRFDIVVNTQTPHRVKKTKVESVWKNY